MRQRECVLMSFVTYVWCDNSTSSEVDTLSLHVGAYPFLLAFEHTNDANTIVCLCIVGRRDRPLREVFLISHTISTIGDSI